VQLAGHRPDQFCQPAFHCGMDILVTFLVGEFLSLEFTLDRLQTGADLRAFLLRQHTRFFKSLRPGEAAAHILQR